jgi:hypothetical protein
LADFETDAHAAHQLGEAVAQCGASITTETVDELFEVFARGNSDQKRAIAAAVSGLIAAAEDGPANLSDFNGKLSSMVRRLGGLGKRPSPHLGGMITPASSAPGSSEAIQAGRTVEP